MDFTSLSDKKEVQSRSEPDDRQQNGLIKLVEALANNESDMDCTYSPDKEDTEDCLLSKPTGKDCLTTCRDMSNRRPRSSEEKDAVKKYYKSYISSGKMPGKITIDQSGILHFTQR